MRSVGRQSISRLWWELQLENTVFIADSRKLFKRRRKEKTQSSLASPSVLLFCHWLVFFFGRRCRTRAKAIAKTDAFALSAKRSASVRRRVKATVHDTSLRGLPEYDWRLPSRGIGSTHESRDPILPLIGFVVTSPSSSRSYRPRRRDAFSPPPRVPAGATHVFAAVPTPISATCECWKCDSASTRLRICHAHATSSGDAIGTAGRIQQLCTRCSFTSAHNVFSDAAAELFLRRSHWSADSDTALVVTVDCWRPATLVPSRCGVMGNNGGSSAAAAAAETTSLRLEKDALACEEHWVVQWHWTTVKS